MDFGTANMIVSAFTGFYNGFKYPMRKLYLVLDIVRYLCDRTVMHTVNRVAVQYYGKRLIPADVGHPFTPKFFPPSPDDFLQFARIVRSAFVYRYRLWGT